MCNPHELNSMCPIHIDNHLKTEIGILQNSRLSGSHWKRINLYYVAIFKHDFHICLYMQIHGFKHIEMVVLTQLKGLLQLFQELPRHISPSLSCTEPDRTVEFRTHCKLMIWCHQSFSHPPLITVMAFKPPLTTIIWTCVLFLINNLAVKS